MEQLKFSLDQRPPVLLINEIINEIICTQIHGHTWVTGARVHLDRAFEGIWGGQDVQGQYIAYNKTQKWLENIIIFANDYTTSTCTKRVQCVWTNAWSNRVNEPDAHKRVHKISPESLGSLRFWWWHLVWCQHTTTISIWIVTVCCFVFGCFFYPCCWWRWFWWSCSTRRERERNRMIVFVWCVYKYEFVLLTASDCHSFHECLIMCDNFSWICDGIVCDMKLVQI